MRESILNDKSLDFSLRMVRLFKHLKEMKSEYIMSKQIFRSGTSIGANIHEAYFGQSKADFIAKLSIALKECGETQYWLKLLRRGEFITNQEFDSIMTNCEELGKILTSSIKTAKQNLADGK